MAFQHTVDGKRNERYEARKDVRTNSRKFVNDDEI